MIYDIPFHTISRPPGDLDNIRQVLVGDKWGANGIYTARCHHQLAEFLKHDGHTPFVSITHSATSALEMAALVADLKPGDEVIMPSWTFASTANAVALRGAVPVFVDIRRDTLNIDETLIEAAITDKTRAIVAVHYAGVCCDMDPINDLAVQPFAHDLWVIEDAAQAFLSNYKSRPAGTLGDMAAFSFHATKQIACGEGGAFIYNTLAGRTNPHTDRAEVAWLKGTNHVDFLRYNLKSYGWADLGSAFAPSDIIAALLSAQLQWAELTVSKARAIYRKYYQGFTKAWGGPKTDKCEISFIPEYAEANGHCFWLRTANSIERESLINYLASKSIQAQAHFNPLHLSMPGKRFGRIGDPRGRLPETEDIYKTIVRLPIAISPEACERVIEEVVKGLNA